MVNLTDSTGEITKSYTYDAFGVEKNIDDTDTNAFRYCGEYYDSESGTIYLRARYYNPTTGRFISRDSYAGKKEDPLSLNLYTYCGNNSLLYFDPSGHSFALPMEAVYITVGLLAVTTLSIVAINANNSQIQSSCRSLSNTIANSIRGDSALIESLKLPSMKGEMTKTKSYFSSPSDSITNPYLSKWSDSFENAKEKVKEKDIATTLEKKKYDPVIFPENPNDFNPVGMTKHSYNQGRIIKWGYTDKIAIFEWNEDEKYGNHYRCMLPEWNSKHSESGKAKEVVHYYAGQIMPEPWASWYKGY